MFHTGCVSCCVNRKILFILLFLRRLLQTPLPPETSSVVAVQYTNIRTACREDRHGICGLVDLFGIESPGITASLAIASHVLGELHRVGAK
jgi:hypothetical protein